MKECTNSNTLAPIVTIKADRVVASSRDVAAYFKKQHAHVLRDIDAITERLPDFGRSNFGATSYTDGWNREQRAIDMTRDHTNIPPSRTIGTTAQ